jgi:diguanylate cyclase (GGDEF)-like protein/PAS domain S-box-containing protein
VLALKKLKQTSIKSLLQLWSLVSIIAISWIAIVALYTNNFFEDSQHQLTEHVLTLESEARQLAVTASSFVVRQENLLTTRSLVEVDNLWPREQLEQSFRHHWENIKETELHFGGSSELINSLWTNYTRFIDYDIKLYNAIKQHHTLEQQAVQKIQLIESLEQEIVEQVESISGHVNLNLSRFKRSIRQQVDGSPNVDATLLLKKLLSNDAEQIQRLSQSVRLTTAEVRLLTTKLIKAASADQLLTIKENQIKQSQATLDDASQQLLVMLESTPALHEMTKSLVVDINRLIEVAILEKNSVYQLRLLEIENQEVLDRTQALSVSVLEDMLSSLDLLSSSIESQSKSSIQRVLELSSNAHWIILVLSLSMIVGMLAFTMVISRLIQEPLEYLRSAMHDLSEENFDTRLPLTTGNSEFSTIAIDFNVFASTTQRLINDLAQANETMESSEQHIRAILNAVPEAILTLSPAGLITSTNPAADKILQAENMSLIGVDIIRFFAKEHHILDIQDLLQSAEKQTEFKGVAFNGSQFRMGLSLTKVRGQTNDFLVCVISDITALKSAEENLKTASSELDTILENAMVGIAFVKHRNLLRVNSKFEELFACKREDVEGQSVRIFYQNNESFETMGMQAYNVLQKGGNYEGEVQMLRQNGEGFWCSLSAKAIDAENPQAGSIWLFEDVTAQRESELALRRLASFDSLTGLPNRTVFNDRLDHAIAKAQRNSGTLAVCFLDLDNFKNINDSLGHKAGDQLLVEVAKRLKACVREGDTVARLGGDEFTVILEEVRSTRYVGKVADKLLTEISRTYMLDSTEVNISPSIGISLYPADGRDIEHLVKNADAAMYYAKKSGRNNFQFYSAEMNEKAVERLAMETALRRAVERKEFYLQFQPQIDIKTGVVAGSEALLRWRNDEWGDVSPAVFVPILEDTGLIGTVGEYVLEAACDAYLELKQEVADHFVMAVNLSGRQFRGGALISYVSDLLEEKAIPPTSLELEITESILMEDSALAVSSLRELGELGLKLAVDDFGTGYSSLSYLKQFPLNVLKVDRSFVRDVTSDQDDAAIVDAILAMSKRLKLEVVAEGVETIEQLEFLKGHGCERVQGYYFSKPLLLSDLIEFTKTTNQQHN